MENKNGNQPSPRPFFPGRTARIVIGIALLLVLAVRLLSRRQDPPFPLNDPAVGNIATLVFAFIAGLTAWLWFSFRSGFSKGARRAVFVAPAIIIGLLLAAFRYVEVSGSMVPRFAPRWEPKPDQRLAAELDTQSPGKTADLTTMTPADFPQFLGPDRNCWLSGPALARDWAARPPRMLWKREIGAGWAGFAAVNGYAVTIEQRGAKEAIVCYEIEAGKPMWIHAIEAKHDDPVGGLGPRSTPTIHRGRVYGLGGTGILQCLEGASGRLLWKDDLRARYGMSEAEDERLVQWGRAGSPLIVDNIVVVPGAGPEGRAKNLVAFDSESGSLVWEAENRKEDGSADQISYASPTLVTLAARRQIVITNESTVSGHDPANGERLWSHPWPGHSNANASASQAAHVGGDRLLLSKGYSGGAEVIEIKDDSSGALQVESVWKNPGVLQTKFTNVVVHDGHAFGLSEEILECVDLATGKRKWKNGRYGHGQILGVGDLILVLSEAGELHLVEANPKQFHKLGSVQVLDGKTWNNLCLYGNRLLVRNAEQANCYELP